MKLIGKKIWSLIASLSALFLHVTGTTASATGGEQRQIDKPSQEIRTTPSELRGSPNELRGSPTVHTASPTALKGHPDKILVAPMPTGGKGLSFLTGGKWTFMPDKSFQKMDQQKNRLVIKEDGETRVFDRNGKLLLTKSDPVAAEIYKALIKSMEMVEKAK